VSAPAALAVSGAAKSFFGVQARDYIEHDTDVKPTT
jgi:hypothetical protein